jgi:hypothetical protein
MKEVCAEKELHPVVIRSASMAVEPYPIDPPLYLNYAGFRGSLQAYGSGRAWVPVYWRAGFSAPGRHQLEASAHVVSRPPGSVVVNPFGFRQWTDLPPAFTSCFLAFVASPKIVPLLSDPNLIEALHRLVEVAENTPVDVYLSPNWVVVRKYCGQRKLRDQIRFVHSVTAVLETLPWMGARTGALPTAPTSGPRIHLEGALCQVCGDPLFNPVALCRACSTPHHMDCWRYVGGCSTYACLALAADIVTVGASEA